MPSPREALSQRGAEARIMSAIEMNKVAEPYIRQKAVAHLRRGESSCSGRHGQSLFQHRHGSGPQALEIDAEVLLKATKVDGVYSADPEKASSPQFFTHLTYQEFLRRNLQVLDMTAVALAMGRTCPSWFSITEKREHQASDSWTEGGDHHFRRSR